MDEPSFPFADPGGAGPAPGLAGRCPLRVRLPGGTPALLARSYDDVAAVLTDPRFSRAAAAAHGMTARSPESLALNSADPPDHTRRRRTVAAAFTARRAEQLRPGVERTAAALLDRMVAAGPPADLVGAYTRPLAVWGVCALLGLPETDHERFAGPVEVMMSVGRFGPDRVAAAHRELFDWFAGRYDERRAAPDPDRADVLADLVAASGPGGRLTRAEAVHVGYGLLMAGYETTTHQLAICVDLLLADRSRWDRLRRDPAGRPAAVEEMLRWTSLVATGGAPHQAVGPVSVGPAAVAAGEVVLPVFAAANRDPAVFAAPDELRLDRAPNPHLAFGRGRHLCLGAPLARVELTAGLAALLDRLPDLTPAGPARWRQGAFVRGLDALPVRW